MVNRLEIGHIVSIKMYWN